MLLKKSHLAHAFRGYPARGHIGHCAASEFQPRVSDIHFVGQHRNAHGLYFGHVLLHECQQDVQVVDHQVVNDIDIQAACGENSQAVHLEKERMIQYRLNCQDRGVESFHVADLQDAPEFSCRVQERVRLGQVRRHRFFDEYIEAHLH
jgi:hypothetical protein